MVIFVGVAETRTLEGHGKGSGGRGSSIRLHKRIMSMWDMMAGVIISTTTNSVIRDLAVSLVTSGLGYIGFASGV